MEDENMATQARQHQYQQQETRHMKDNIDHAMHGLVKLKKEIILLGVHRKEKSDKAWNELMVLSEKITKLWKGPGVVEEIREQREKKW